MKWYYALNDRQMGPVSEMELTSLGANAVIGPDTMVWRPGMTEWQPFRRSLSYAVQSIASGGPQLGGVAIVEENKDLVVQQMREGVISGMPAKWEYGGFRLRFAAYSIDAMVLAVPNKVVGTLLTMATGVSHQMDASHGLIGMLRGTLGLFAVLIAGQAVLDGLYSVLMVGTFGATVGKMAMELKIVAENGGKVSYARSFGRYCGEFVSSIIVYFGYLMVIFDSEKRALHDQLASTRVIRTR